MPNFQIKYAFYNRYVYIIYIIPGYRKQYRRLKNTNNIRDIIETARANVYRNINFNMVLAYWNIGKVIVDVEQEGKERADYGKKLIEKLSLKLTEDLGKGFSRQNLQNMKQFYKCFKNCQTLSGKLSWSHYILLMRISNEDTRDFYLKEAEDEMWSLREMMIAETYSLQDTGFACRQKRTLKMRSKEKGK